MLPVTAYIAVGSNIDPEYHIPRALGLLQNAERITGVSSWYRSAALGRPEQNDFINGMVRVQTRRAARTLKLEVLRAIERALGRVRSDDKYAARSIDLDLVLYGAEVICEHGLTVPDPDIRTRAFIAQPLLDLAPGLILPDTGERLAECGILHLGGELCREVEMDNLIRNLLRL